MARHFRELVVWQQADALRRDIWAVVRRTPGMDPKFRTPWADAARSVCSNTAEGFGRRSHREFARFLELASSSLREIENLIHEARMRGHLTDDNVNNLQRQVRRTSAPLARLLRYLRDNPDRGEWRAPVRTCSHLVAPARTRQCVMAYTSTLMPNAYPSTENV